MIGSILRPLFAAAFLVAVASPALAQGTPQSFDQYPSFVELTSTTPDGAKAVLRCGYSSADGHSITLDAGFREISVINEGKKFYSRIQRIDDFIIATSTDPTGGPGLLMELVKPDGTVMAKNCQTDVNTEAIGNCHPVRPFTFGDQVKAGDARVAQQCVDLMNQNGAQVNASLANPQKTEAFKSGLRQKASVLAKP